MTQPLWTWDALLGAAGGTADGVPASTVTGFSIDSRALEPGDVFVALKDARDGHEFVPAAFAAGASAALVSESYRRAPGDGALIRVADPLEGLIAIGRAARARTSARVIAVTGSVGKTGTKTALQACLSRLGPTHASEKSFNNHWGVPLTLARMPAESAYGVFEMGMNHRGEIAPLAKMVRPHVAVITTIEPVHLGHLGSIEAIAEEKSDIFLGLGPSGIAVIKRDSPQFQIMLQRALAAGARILTFGLNPASDIRGLAMTLEANGSDVTASSQGRNISYRVGAPGAHLAENSLAVVAALAALGADAAAVVPALAGIVAPPGRGGRTVLHGADGAILLVDESYNANPASMRAALAALATVPRSQYARRIAVLGDMLELGDRADELHVGLKQAVAVAGIDQVFACGPHMAKLFAVLGNAHRGSWADRSENLVEPLLASIKAGDAVMIKGSLGTRMAPIVQAVRRRFGQ